jgi:hypothetical protein
MTSSQHKAAPTGTLHGWKPVPPWPVQRLDQVIEDGLLTGADIPMAILPAMAQSVRLAMSL